MPFHIKSVGAMGSGNIYFKGGETWTQVYADRKQYSAEADADAQKAASITRTLGGTSYNYQLDIFKNATVVSE